MGWVDKTFVSVIGLIVITILVIEVGKRWEEQHIEIKLPEPPPRTSLEPVTEEDQEDDDDSIPPYKPLYSRSAIARAAQLLDGSWSSDYDKFDFENLQEGFGITDFFSILGEIFKLAMNAIYLMVTFPDHIIAFGQGFIKLGIGVIHLFMGVIKQLMSIFGDTMRVIGDITKCGLTWSKNLRTCFLWYVLEMLVYVGVVLLFWVPIYILRLLTFNKVDLNPLFLRFFGCSDANPYHRMRDLDGRICKQDGFFEKLDQKIHQRFKFHFMHFPDSVCETCYGCNLIGDLGTLIYDLTLGFLMMLLQPMEDVFDSGKYFWHAFYLDNWM